MIALLRWAVSMLVVTGLGCGSNRPAPPPSCDRDNGGCDVNAVCLQRAAGPACLCKAWYSGDGRTCAPAGGQVGSPWPMEAGNVRRTGQSAHVGPQTSHVRWSVANGFASLMAPVVDADGTIYVLAEGVHALNPDGTTRWTAPIPTADMSRLTTVLGSNGRLYFVGGVLRALDTANPAAGIEWSYPQANDPGSNGALLGIAADGTVYFGTWSVNYSYGGPLDAKVYAVPPLAALANWTYADKTRPDNPAAIAPDGTLFIASGDGADIQAVGADGQLRWTTPLADGAATTAVIGPDGTIYVGDISGNLYAIDPATGAARTFKAGYFVLSLAIDAGGVLYAGIRDTSVTASVIAIDPATIGGANTVRWALALGDAYDRIRIVLGADGTLYATKDRLYAIDANGAMLWSSSDKMLPGPAAIGADGTLYVVGRLGTLYAFGP